MMKRMMYICEKCGQIYDNDFDAENCERNEHVMPIGIDEKSIHFLSALDYEKHRYPPKIRIVMENGDLVTYYLDRKVQV